MPESIPLCVDLDHTLLHTDMARRSFAQLVRTRPWKLVHLAAALPAGRAGVKRALGRHVPFEAATLPYRQAMLDYIAQARAEGRHTVLATAANEVFAHAIAQHLGIFDEVIASDGVNNMKGSDKTAALVARFGARGYDYAGDCDADLPVWRQAHAAILVNYSEARFQQRCSDTPIAAAIRD